MTTSDTLSPVALRARLAALSYAEVRELSRTADIPFTTLWKIRMGDTSDPRLTTALAVWAGLQDTKAPA